MKILYGVQGTGNGHITRARAMSKAFTNSPAADVDYLFSGRPKDKYFDMEPFGQWRSLEGLTFRHKAGRVSPSATIKNNRLTQLVKDIYRLDVSQYDLIITDFEPITAWAGKFSGKPVIGVGHQYAFWHDIPKQGDNWAAQKVMEVFAPVSLGLGLHWHHFGAPILPPIADTGAQSVAVEDDKILVYLGFEEPEKVKAMLAPIEGYQFYYYGEFAEAYSEGSIHCRPLSREGFQRDLASANGVICNAGFELASEALELGKKLLVKPLFGQMEQLSNALALEQLGLGSAMETLNSNSVRHWLDNQPNIKIHYPDVAGAIAEWLLRGDWTPHARATLCRHLWEAVETDDIEDYSRLNDLLMAL